MTMIERVEPVLLTLLRFAPFEPQRLLLERLLREAYPEALRDGAFEPLRGRWLRIELLNGPGWNITLGDDAPIVVAGPVRWDVRVAARLDDFVLLANQQVDPDTLFFQRRLVIEGDTELGLVVKNLIFGSELAGVPATIARLMMQVRGFFEGSRVDGPVGGVARTGGVFSRRLDESRRAQMSR